jgi:hypothetical protein
VRRAGEAGRLTPLIILIFTACTCFLRFCAVYAGMLDVDAYTPLLMTSSRSFLLSVDFSLIALKSRTPLLPRWPPPRPRRPPRPARFSVAAAASLCGFTSIVLKEIDGKDQVEQHEQALYCELMLVQAYVALKVLSSALHSSNSRISFIAAYSIPLSSEVCCIVHDVHEYTVDTYQEELFPNLPVLCPLLEYAEVYIFPVVGCTLLQRYAGVL